MFFYDFHFLSCFSAHLFELTTREHTRALHNMNVWVWYVDCDGVLCRICVHVCSPGDGNLFFDDLLDLDLLATMKV
jgi:hypothetical protein